MARGKSTTAFEGSWHAKVLPIPGMFKPPREITNCFASKAFSLTPAFMT